MVTSFKRSRARTAVLCAPNPAAGHHQPTPLPETPGHSQASLGQSLVGSWVLVCTRFCLCPPRVCFPSPVGKVLVGLCWGKWRPPPRGLLPYPGLLHPEPLPLRQATVDPYLHRSVQFTQSCPTLCNPMDHSRLIFPVHHQFPEITQSHVHPVNDAIQPRYTLSAPSPPAFKLSQHQGLF